LIRTKSDRGIVVILDNRIVNKPYGRSFLQALPKCPMEII
jgi:ATP-dependent DNA helicase DinG